jgi:antitoxin MazE
MKSNIHPYTDKRKYLTNSVLCCIIMYLQEGDTMTTSVKKWGNSLALRIPKDIAQTLHLENNTSLELDIRDGALVITPKKDTPLAELVSGITANNLHHAVETGGALGNEEW